MPNNNFFRGPKDDKTFISSSGGQQKATPAEGDSAVTSSGNKSALFPPPEDAGIRPGPEVREKFDRVLVELKQTFAKFALGENAGYVAKSLNNFQDLQRRNSATDDPQATIKPGNGS